MTQSEYERLNDRMLVLEEAFHLLAERTLGRLGDRGKKLLDDAAARVGSGEDRASRRDSEE